MQSNIGIVDRYARLVTGILALSCSGRMSKGSQITKGIIASFGAMKIAEGVTGWCPMIQLGQTLAGGASQSQNQAQDKQKNRNQNTSQAATQSATGNARQEHNQTQQNAQSQSSTNANQKRPKEHHKAYASNVNSDSKDFAGVNSNSSHAGTSTH